MASSNCLALYRRFPCSFKSRALISVFSFICDKLTKIKTKNSENSHKIFLLSLREFGLFVFFSFWLSTHKLLRKTAVHRSNSYIISSNHFWTGLLNWHSIYQMRSESNYLWVPAHYLTPNKVISVVPVTPLTPIFYSAKSPTL